MADRSAPDERLVLARLRRLRAVLGERAHAEAVARALAGIGRAALREAERRAGRRACRPRPRAKQEQG
ncbi:hypothetical protein [Salinarimonas rosea]|uniref:hypothetical protein n=1 Tax=Salinarimonas rosea TaxID=552063 RepID=UPI000424A08A|nr:hypothetical protein [Salinarimonas rosea]